MKLLNHHRHKRLLVHILCLVAAIGIFVSTAVAAKTNTFLMLSGIEYKNVPYRVLSSYKVVEITADGTKMNLSYADIAAIYDSTEQDVTRLVIGRTSRAPQTEPAAKDSTQTAAKATSDSVVAQQETPVADSVVPSQPAPIQPEAKPVVTAPQQQQQEPWVSKEEKSYKEGQKSKWSVLFSALGNYTIPTGDYYEGIDGSVGFEGEIMIPVSREVGIGAIVSKAGLTTDIDGLDISSWKYFFMFHYLIETNNRKNLVYLSAGAGVTHLSASGGGDETNFTLPSKVGIILALGQTTGLNLGAGYDLSFVPGYDSDGNDATATAFELNVRAGITFAIPRKSK